MATTQDITTTETTAHTLAPVLSARYALRWQHCVMVGLFVVMFLYVNYLPLFHAVTWRHACIGATILAQGSLPIAEPALPLAAGMRWFPASWLGDVVLAGVHRAGGAEAISNFGALTVLAMLLIFGRIAYLLTDRKRFVLLAVAALFAAHWSRLAVPRPELFGAVCLLGLLWILAGQPARSTWFTLPALLLVWANLDASVVLGVAVLACWVVGKFWEVAAVDHRASLRRAISDPQIRRTLALVQLSVLMTLVQPQGLDLWADWTCGLDGVVGNSLGGLHALSLFSGTGAACAAVWLLTGVALRFSRRRILASEVLFVLLASVLVAMNHEWLIWFVPLALFALLPHLADVADRFGWLGEKPAPLEFEEGQPVPVFTFAFSLLALLLVWMGFALSPISSPLLGGKPRALARLHSGQTPLAVAHFLKQHPADGLVWAPEYWGDWLAWSAGNVDVVANSNLTHLPPRVRAEFLWVYGAEGNWSRTLDRYGADVLVLDKQRQEKLLESALGQPVEWTVAFEDSQAVVLRRKEA